MTEPVAPVRESRPSRATTSLLVALSIGAGVVALDVATKNWSADRLAVSPISMANGLVVLTHSRNPGAAFGTATSLTPLLSVVAAIAVAALVFMARRTSRRLGLLAVGLGLGGAAGNLVDRLFRAPGPLRGQVVDWVDIGSWPTFNLADSALVSAAVLAVVLTSGVGSRRGAPGSPASESPGRAS